MTKFDTILILAGGQSSRFWPLSDKNLFVFEGKPLLESQLEFYSSYSDKIIIVANVNNKEAVSKIATKFGAIVTVQEKQGQAAAILSAKQELAGVTFIVNGADTYKSSLVTEILNKLSEGVSDAVVTARKVDSYFPGGYYKMEGDQVRDVIEKPGQDRMPSTYFRIVAEVYRDIGDFVKTIENTEETEDHFEKALSTYIKSSNKITLVNYNGPFAALKYPWHVLSMMNFFLDDITDYRGKNVTIDKTAIIEGPCYIEEGVQIQQYSKIVGPCYIAENTVIGNFSLVLKSMIGENSVIGAYSEATRSYIGDRVLLHHNYIGDSVLEGDILFGGGALTANFRLDKKTIRSVIKGESIDSGRAKLGAVIGREARIGVNASLMPGVKIASGAEVLPTTLVQTDVT